MPSIIYSWGTELCFLQTARKRKKKKKRSAVAQVRTVVLTQLLFAILFVHSSRSCYVQHLLLWTWSCLRAGKSQLTPSASLPNPVPMPRYMNLYNMPLLSRSLPDNFLFINTDQRPYVLMILPRVGRVHFDSIPLLQPQSLGQSVVPVNRSISPLLIPRASHNHLPSPIAVDPARALCLLPFLDEPVKPLYPRPHGGKFVLGDVWLSGDRTVQRARQAEDEPVRQPNRLDVSHGRVPGAKNPVPLLPILRGRKLRLQQRKKGLNLCEALRALLGRGRERCGEEILPVALEPGVLDHWQVGWNERRAPEEETGVIAPLVDKPCDELVRLGRLCRRRQRWRNRGQVGRRFHLAELEARVKVDITANGQDWDAAVGDTQGVDVWARENGRLDLFGGVD